MDSAAESYISIQYSNHWKDISNNSYKQEQNSILLDYNRLEGIRKVEHLKYCQIFGKVLTYVAVIKQHLLKVEIKHESLLYFN